jgi:hypothetical protein
MRHEEYEQNVFINCPFDAEYAPLFEAIVFAVNDARLPAEVRPRTARFQSGPHSEDRRADLRVAIFHS